MQPIHVCWNWNLQSTPGEIWPWISNTDRFNRDSAVPAIEQSGQARYRKLLSLEKLGVKVEWEEEPFEWVRPERFGVLRRYRRGPLAEMRVLAELSETRSGTNLCYQVWALPRNLVSAAIVRLQLFESGIRFRSTAQRYDRLLTSRIPMTHASETSKLTSPAKHRLERAIARLIAAGRIPAQAQRLSQFIEFAEDRDAIRMRPYELADNWNFPRRQILELFLNAASLNILELQWDLLCPLCRGAKQSSSSLDAVTSHVHCDACQIDFSVDFDRSVEVTFRPAPAVRTLDVEQYCVGGPQTVPHIVVQQIMPSHSKRLLQHVALEPGAYRFRRWGSIGGQPIRATNETTIANVILDADSREPVDCGPGSVLQIENPTSEEQVLLLERVAWNDQAATAADVTSLQAFRDLFAPEALRPSEQIEVSQLTVMFTNLRDFTKMCQENGDVASYGRVVRHFDVVSEAVTKNGGALIKTIGDGTMSVFRQPGAAVLAASDAMRRLAQDPSERPPLYLKAGIHCGQMIAVTLNDRLDYFGATVNLAAHAAALADGSRITVSDAVLEDREVRGWCIDPEPVEASSNPPGGHNLFRVAPVAARSGLLTADSDNL